MVWLGTAFAIFGSIADFGIGNTVQSNSVAAARVLIGGIKRIADVAGTLVPLMATFYIAASLIVLGTNIVDIPAAQTKNPIINLVYA